MNEQLKTIDFVQRTAIELAMPFPQREVRLIGPG